MILGLFRKSVDTEAVYAVYSAIVAQSRQPRFYADWGVPDTVTGRFDMICLHLALLFGRLRAEGKAATDFSQAVFDLFFKDMDRSLREMGASDLGVPKKIQKMGNLFYGLMANLNEAIASGVPGEVEAVVARNVFEGRHEAGTAALARYLVEEAARLRARPVAEIVAGRLTGRGRMSGRLRIADASIRLDSMPAEGRDLAFEVDADERAALAAQLGVGAVEALRVRPHADRFRGGMRVTGGLAARIVQPSVVSLEPVAQEIDEAIDRVFLPGGEKPYAGAAEAEIFVDLEGEDVPDHFEGPEADLSDLIVETLSLAIDPYPRREGESLADLGIAGVEDAPESPFAGLEALRKRDSGD